MQSAFSFVSPPLSLPPSFVSPSPSPNSQCMSQLAAPIIIAQAQGGREGGGEGGREGGSERGREGEREMTLAAKPVAADAPRMQNGGRLFLAIQDWMLWATLLSQLGF